MPAFSKSSSSGRRLLQRGTTLSLSFTASSRARQRELTPVEAAEAIQARHRQRMQRRRVLKNQVFISCAIGSALKRVRITRLADLPIALARESGKVTMSVEDEQRLAGLRLWEQGDEEMYTRENLEKRYRNRSNKQVWHYVRCHCLNLQT